MASNRTDTFRAEFRVLAYFNDNLENRVSSTGIPSYVSATVFERVATGERILAIRGTNDAADLATDLVNVAILGSNQYQRQYAALSTQVAEWAARGILTPGFTVTGHSLGGFLAVALTADLGSSIGHTYIFNAPGLGGLQVPGGFSFINDWLAALRPNRPSVDPSKVTNITAQGGSSLIAGLGIGVGERVQIAVETERRPSINPLELWNSHRIVTLVDALAVYDLLATIDPSLSIPATTRIVEAASALPEQTLERVLRTLALVLGTTPPAATETRGALFDQILEIRTAFSAAGGPGVLRIVQLLDRTSTEIAALAREDIAVRHALRELDTFALSGRAELFAARNRSGELDIGGPDGSGGQLTAQWLSDRAEFLLAQAFVNTHEAGSIVQRRFGPSMDFVLLQPGLDPQTVRVAGADGLRPAPSTVQVIFGSDGNDTIRGLNAADRLYGGAGNDRIRGGPGNDMIEGGPGDDDLAGEEGDNRLYGGAGDDTLAGGPGINRLEGGIGFDVYVLSASDGRGVIFDSDGSGEVRLDGAVLSGGREVRPGEYASADGSVRYAFAGRLDEPGTLFIGEKFEIQGFRNGNLGITLVSAEPAPARSAGGERYYLDSPYDVENSARMHSTTERPRGLWGSADADTFEAGPRYGAKFFGFAGNDHLIGGGTMNVELHGGAGDDVIENRPVAFEPGTLYDRFPHLIAGEAGRDVITGSSDAEIIFGDFYRISMRAISAGVQEIQVDGLYIRHGLDGETASRYVSFHDVHDFVGDLLRTYPGGVAEALAAFVGYALGAIPADAFDDLIDAGAGDDTVVGGAGNDRIYGGEGNDRLHGDYAFDSNIPYHQRAVDETGFEQYLAFFGDSGDDYIDGGPGHDAIFDEAIRSSVVFGGEGDDLISIRFRFDPEGLQDVWAFADGGPGNDYIRVKANHVEIIGGEGDDWIIAEALWGIAFVDAGPGDDRITASGDIVFIDGGPGADRYEVSGLRVTIREDDSDTVSTDVLVLAGTPQQYWFSRDGDALRIGSWMDISTRSPEWAETQRLLALAFADLPLEPALSDIDAAAAALARYFPDFQPGGLPPDPLEAQLLLLQRMHAYIDTLRVIVEAQTWIENWFAGNSIERIVFVALDGTEIAWTADEIDIALLGDVFAWADFEEPEVPPFQPIVLALPEPATPEPDPLPADSQPAAPPPAYSVADAPEPEPAAPPLAPDAHIAAGDAPLDLRIIDALFRGSIQGSSGDDRIVALSSIGVRIDAGDGSDIVTTGSGSDRISLGAGSHVVQTGAGDDRIVLERFEGAKRVDAGEGIDAAWIPGTLSSYAVRIENGAVVFRDGRGNSLDARGVEIFEFSGGTLVSAGAGEKPGLGLVYETMFGDNGAHLSSWIDQIASGRPLAEIVRSIENMFAGGDGQIGGQGSALATALLQRAFAIAHDPGRLLAWLGQLYERSIWREQIAAQFPDSDEAQIALTGLVMIPDPAL